MTEEETKPKLTMKDFINSKSEKNISDYIKQTPHNEIPKNQREFGHRKRIKP